MRRLSNRRAVRRFGLAAVMALAGVLLAAKPASAQYFIAPDRSVVYLGPQQVFFTNPGFSVTPVVIPGNQYVRMNMNVSMTFPNFMGSPPPGFGFITPFYANDRALGANFFGSRRYNPAPIITGPFQKWW